MIRKMIVPLLVLLFLVSCDAPPSGRMMRRISPIDGKCYLYVPLGWADETDPQKEYKASLTDESGVTTVSFTWEELRVEEENEQFWEHWLSDEWWEDFWAAERRPSWQDPVIDSATLCNQGGYSCTYTEGEGAAQTRTTLIVVVNYDVCYRLRFTEPAASDHSAAFEEIRTGFLWK